MEQSDTEHTKRPVVQQDRLSVSGLLGYFAHLDEMRRLHDKTAVCDKLGFEVVGKMIFLKRISNYIDV